MTSPPDPARIAYEATAPARWLLDAAQDGVALTQTHALARAVVRAAAERWPGWWNAELFGPPHREADVRVLEAMHDGLKRLRLVRRRGRVLHATARGRQLAADPGALLQALADDLGGGDPFTELVAAEVIDQLRAHEHREHDQLGRGVAARARRGGWRDLDGQPPTERAVSWVLSDVLCRGEAYGLVERHLEPAHPRLRRLRLSLTAAGRLSFGADPQGSTGMPALIFDAHLLNVKGVRARLAVRADQHLTALHDAIQEAFGWYDDHLYSFWLDGTFWGDEASEITSPITPDHGVHTADLPIAELDLAVGAKLAYVFDFGDEWRVRLTLRASEESDDGTYPRVLRRHGEAPPQYPAEDDEPEAG